MEMEDEKTAEIYSLEDDNLNDNQYEITHGNPDSGDLDLDIVDFDVMDDEGAKIANEQETGELTVSDLEDLNLDVFTEDDEDEKHPDFENDDESLDNLPPLHESDLVNIDIVEPLDDVAVFARTNQQEDLFEKFVGDDLSSLSFAGKQLVIFDTAKEQSDLLKKYLCERTGMYVECVRKKENLWRLLKIDPLDLIILETGTEGKTDAMELMQQTKDQFPEVHFICLSGPVSLDKRLQFLNAGALDYLTRPLHLSTIAQSILVQFNRTELYEIDAEVEGFASEPKMTSRKKSLLSMQKNQNQGQELGDFAKQSDDDLHLHVEIDLIDEDF
jgi:DNA-binding response OmpR family regulator